MDETVTASHPRTQLADFVASIDQGTTSTRCMIFDHQRSRGRRHQLEHEQILPQAGGWNTTRWDLGADRAVLTSALTNTHLSAGDIAAMGITNQRETSVVWNRTTGRPYYNAIVWQDTGPTIAAALDRNERGDIIRRKAGLPPPPTFRGKLQWILGERRRVGATPNVVRRCSAPPTPGCCGT